MDIFTYLDSPEFRAKSPVGQLAIRQDLWNTRQNSPGFANLSEEERLAEQSRMLGQASTPLPPEPSGLWNLVRAPLAFARGAASTVGTPVDIANLPSAALAPLLNIASRKAGYGDIFQSAPIPGGSADISALLTSAQRAAGVPEAGGPWERLAENVPEMAGSMVAPGAVLRKIAGATRLPELFSTGKPLLDALIGSGAGVGKTVGQEVVPGSPTAETVGALLGGVGPTVIGQLAKASAAKTLSGLGARPLTPAQQAIQANFTQEGIRNLPSEATGAPGIKALEELPRYSLTGRTALARTAQQELQQGEQAFTGALSDISPPPPPPIGGYPMSAEMAGKAQQAVEPNLIAERAALKTQQQQRLTGRMGTAEETAAQQNTQAQAQAGALIDDVNTRIHKLESAAQIKEATVPLLYEQRKTLGKVFDATEKVTGDTPVVTMNSTRNKLAQLLQEAQQTGFAPPRGTEGVAGRIELASQQAAPTFSAQGQQVDVEDILKALTPENMAKLPPAERAKAESYLAHARAGIEHGQDIPFWVARRMESRFRELGGTAPIGGITQGAARSLQNAIRSDIDSFLRTTPEGQVIQPDLARAKTQYRQLHAIMNDSALTKLFSQSPHAGEEFLDSLFSGDKLDPLRLMKEQASPETWKVVSAFKLADIFDKSMIRTPRGTEFSPLGFVRKAQKLQQSGQLDFLLDPGSPERQQFDAMLTDFSKGAAAQKTTATTIRNEEGVLSETERAALTQQQNATRTAAKQQAITISQPPEVSFRPGDINATLRYSAKASPQEFDLSVQRWAEGVQKDVQDYLALPDTTAGSVAVPSKIVKEIKPLVDSGQLNIMLQKYPGLADRLTKQVQLFERMTEGSERLARAGQRPSLVDRITMRHGVLGLGTMVAGAVLGHPVAGLLAGGAEIAGMEAVSHLLATRVRTPTGVKLLSEGLSPKYSPAAIGFAARILAGGASAQSSAPSEKSKEAPPAIPSVSAPAAPPPVPQETDKQAAIRAFLQSSRPQQPIAGQ